MAENNTPPRTANDDAVTPESDELSRSMQSTRQQRRAVVSGTVGSALEWFDFAVYGSLSATLFPSLFFSNLGEAGAILASFATFFVGFLARPLGAFCCGYLGDRFGRRPILLGSFLAMGIASLVIGLLPTGQGIAVATILVALRFVQGFSLGGEATGAQLMTMEHAVGNRRGILGALMTIGSPISQVLANLTLAWLAATLSPEDWAAWGWRVPFIASLGLVIVGLYIRFRLEETRAYRVQQELASTTTDIAARPNGFAVFASQPGTVVKLTLQWSAFVMTFYIIAVYGLSYIGGNATYDASAGFITLLVANLVSIFASLLGGWSSDRIGRKPVMFIGCATMFVGALTFFPAVDTGSVVLTTLTATIALSGVQFGFGAQPAFFAEQFPTSTRFTGSAMALTLSGLIFAAPAPYIAAWLGQISDNSQWLVVGMNLIVIVISVVFTFTLSDKNRQRDLATFVTKD